jgi:hypothetical protein
MSQMRQLEIHCNVGREFAVSRAIRFVAKNGKGSMPIREGLPPFHLEILLYLCRRGTWPGGIHAIHSAMLEIRLSLRQLAQIPVAVYSR